VNPRTTHTEPSFSASDIRRAAIEGVVSEDSAEALIRWAGEQNRATGNPMVAPVEYRKGLNWVSVAYYFGATLMISACAWFLGDKWEILGSAGVLTTTIIYMIAAAAVGLWLRRRGYLVAGGLLVTVAVSLVPLITYSIEDLVGLWPAAPPGAYKDFYPWIRASWIAMELATAAAAAVALRCVAFGFLTAPMAFALWFLSMDLAAWLGGASWDSWSGRQQVSIGVGLVTLLIGLGTERTLRKREASPAEDYPFWCYLFGLLAFWGGLTSMQGSSELGRAFYALLNAGLVGIAVARRRATFLVFGALGLHVYVGHLAYDVFGTSILFPFVLALLGLSLIMVTVWAQRHLLRTGAGPGGGGGLGPAAQCGSVEATT
jgi:hypothetical protein